MNKSDDKVEVIVSNIASIIIGIASIIQTIHEDKQRGNKSQAMLPKAYCVINGSELLSYFFFR